MTEEEVKAVVAEGAEAGALEHEERHMIERVLRLADKPVRALMTPRNDVAWLDRNASPEEIVLALKTQSVTRFVVADRRIDNVVGVVVAKDLLDQALEGAPLSLAKVLRQPLVLPDNLNALDALDRMRHDTIGIAVVLDEYGSFEGWSPPSTCWRRSLASWARRRRRRRRGRWSPGPTAACCWRG
ncbi:CBS domain-containing protein [Paeniroseomonas aquatica]|uniref:CBS domain-containing protein n=1 Tax=Paeniroseomonas aquatica TaxID=373043 RepID=UPI0036239C89